MRVRKLLLVAAIIVGGLGVAALTALLALPFVELGPFAAGQVAAAVGRGARVGGLRVSPGRWITVELRDLVVDNLAGGSRPDMLTVARLSAEVDALTLLGGPVLVRKLTLGGLDLLLEKVGEARTPNWRTGGSPAPASAQPGSRPPDYARLPTLLDATVEAKVTFRSRSGKALVTTLEGVRIVAPDAVQPVRLSGPGSYQGVPIALEAVLASFDAIRAAPKPVPSEISLASGDTKLAFKGTMTAPLELDGAQGELTIDAPTPGAIERIAGVAPAPAPPLRLVGTLERNDPEWHLAHATGSLGSAELRDGDITLVEGRPDRISVALDFDKVDLDALLGPGNEKPGNSKPGEDPRIVVGRDPDTLLDAKLSAASLAYSGLLLLEPSVDATLQPGRIEVGALAFGYVGGQVRGSGRIETEAGDASARVQAGLELEALDVQAVARLLEAGALPLAGRVTGRASLEAQGATLKQAMRGAHGSAVLTMRGGSIAREVVELASTDARTLFRTARGMTGIACVLGIVDVRAGVATVSPLRIRSASGTIVGRGRADLYRHSLDLTIASESATTSAFALDVPIRVSGSFASPSIAPAKLSGQGRAQLAAGDSVARLLPELRAYALQSPCLERGR